MDSVGFRLGWILPFQLGVALGVAGEFWIDVGFSGPDPASISDCGRRLI